MAEAIQLAERGLYTTTPNPCVGCVLVKNDKIVGRGWHVKAGDSHKRKEQRRMSVWSHAALLEKPVLVLMHC